MCPVVGVGNTENFIFNVGKWKPRFSNEMFTEFQSIMK